MCRHGFEILKSMVVLAPRDHHDETYKVTGLYHKSAKIRFCCDNAGYMLYDVKSFEVWGFDDSLVPFFFQLMTVITPVGVFV
jgi:hypothetical protein